METEENNLRTITPNSSNSRKSGHPSCRANIESISDENCLESSFPNEC